MRSRHDAFTYTFLCYDHRSFVRYRHELATCCAEHGFALPVAADQPSSNAAAQDFQTLGVAIWGCGPVGQFAITSAWRLGTARVMAIDQGPERLALAQQEGPAETLNCDDTDIVDA